MAQVKYDGVIEAVRHTPAGQVTVVRAYEATPDALAASGDCLVGVSLF